MTSRIPSLLATSLHRLNIWTLRILNPQDVFLALARHDFAHRQYQPQPAGEADENGHHVVQS